MAKKPTSSPAPDINPDAYYSVTLKRPIKLGRSGTYARPGLDLTLKGSRLLEHLEDVDGYSEITE